MQLKGIHGTTKYHADNIEKNGFIIPVTGSGKGGRGLYFWNYDLDKRTALILAHKWWEFACNKKKPIYDLTKDCSLVSFDVRVNIESEKILDFVQNHEIKEKFTLAYPIDLDDDEFSYGAKLDLFIDKLEKASGLKFDVVKLGLSVPNLKNVPFANSFPALVIKNQINVILNEVIR